MIRIITEAVSESAAMDILGNFCEKIRVFRWNRAIWAEITDGR
jgi:hypothetical protein